MSANSLFIILCLCACAGQAPHASPVPLADEHERRERAHPEQPHAADVFHRQGFDGSAAVVLPSGEERCFGDCEARYSPASTFKIPHALIALDAGVLSGPSHMFTWDGQERALPVWNRDHTLASAIDNSVVWYFQRVAPLVGRDRFEEDLRSFRYGNATVGADLTQFWLDDTLAVSPMEQARFWRRLQDGELPVSEGSRDAVLEMSTLARSGASVLRGKTGWHPAAPVGGWFVGSLQTAGAGVVTFAVRLTAPAGYDATSFLAARRAVAEDLLAELGFEVPH